MGKGIDMLFHIVLLLVGFFILIKGSTFFVDGASSVAEEFKIPKMIIGIVIIAFGTCLPEFAVSIKAIMSGNGNIIVGNVIGSNILNILLILGCCSLIHPFKVKKKALKDEIPFLFFMTFLFALLLSDSLFNKSVSFSRIDGLIVLTCFGFFLYYLFFLSKGTKDESKKKKKVSLKKAIILLLVGLVGVVLGSNFVVDSAVSLAEQLGVSERFIALTAVALGTSLPELVTSITALKKNEFDFVLGNVIGSNFFNIGMVMGLPVSLFGGIQGITFSFIDLIVLVLAPCLLFLFSFRDFKISRKEGASFLIILVLYYSYLFIN